MTIIHASETKFSLPWLGALSSDSIGWDSCLAAACNTRSCTADVEGEVGNPILFGSSLPLTHEIACALTLTGASNNLVEKEKKNDGDMKTVTIYRGRVSSLGMILL